MNMDTNQKNYYIDLIKKIDQRNASSRLTGWINNFFKIMYYKLLMFLNKSFEIKVKTFWDGRIDIILPESVSIKYLAKWICRK